MLSDGLCGFRVKNAHRKKNQWLKKKGGVAKKRGVCGEKVKNSGNKVKNSGEKQIHHDTVAAQGQQQTR
jgi:hypothetical protein